MEVVPAHLEYWMRDYYFSTEVDIGCSGVENFSFGELRQLFNITPDDLDQIMLRDSRTLGDPDLRSAIGNRWANGKAERVMATNGSSEAIYLTMRSLLDPGDEVVVLDPSYQQLFSIAESIGCKLKRWPLRFENSFRPDLNEARRLIDPQTRMIVVNFPHNPTGTSLTPAEQDELIELAAGAGAYLVWDAAFAEITYDGPPLPDPGERYDRSITLGTLSKAYGLPGLRVGWCLAAPDVLERLVRLRDYTTLALSPLVEHVATRAIENGDLLLRPRLVQARSNLELLLSWANGHSEFVSVVRPQGGVCVFMRLHDVADSEDFCRRLADEYSVLLVPGTSFGQPNHVRLGFGCSTRELSEGLSRLAEHFHKYHQFQPQVTPVHQTASSA
ncbi:MAG TPA: capreomycidine synthase [Pyrinomonadaceae bacterium]|nr:capreomycidine synthase [Pyrinomonadaceae bacterium]